MRPLYLAVCPLSLLFTSLSLLQAYFRVLLVDGQSIIVSFEKGSYIRRGSHQRILQRESPCPLTFLCSHYSRPRAPIRGSPLRRRSLFKYGGYLQANSLTGGYYCSRAAVFRCSHTGAMQLRSSCSWSPHLDDLLFQEAWRRPDRISSRSPFNTLQHQGSLLVDNCCIHPRRSVCHTCMITSVLCYKAGGSSSSQLLTASARDTAPSDRTSSIMSPHGWVIRFMLKTSTQGCAGKTDMLCVEQSCSALNFPRVPTCNSEITAGSCFGSTANGCYRLSRNKTAPTSPESFLSSVAGPLFPLGTERSAAAFFRRGVEISPCTPDCRLDVFLTKCIGISRTLVVVHFIKGRNVWINEALCVTPSRRLRVGDCVTCFLASSRCKYEVKGDIQQIKHAHGIGDYSREGKNFSRPQSFDDQHIGQQSERCETVPKSHENVPAELTCSKTFNRRDCQRARADGISISVKGFSERAHVTGKGKDLVGTDTNSVAPARTRLTAEAQTKAVETSTASGNGELPKADQGPSACCSTPSRDLDTDEENAQQELVGVNHRIPVSLVPDNRPIHILYEDDHILVLNKPANVLTHPPELNIRNIGRYNAAGSVVQRLLHYFCSSKDSVPETFAALLPSPESGVMSSESSQLVVHACPKLDVNRVRSGKDFTEKGVEEHSEEASEGTAFFEKLIRIPRSVSRPQGIVHRLDFGTTGVLAVAKTFAAAADLREQWKRREVFKGYIGVCRPELKARQKIDAPITRHQVDRTRMHALDPSYTWYSANRVGKSETGRPVRIGNVRIATTIVSPLGGNSAWGLVAATTLTGRTHQVRVHLEYAGHPLVGDKVYGRLPKKRNQKRVAEVKQSDQARARWAGRAGVEKTAKLSVAGSQKKTSSETEILRQLCSLAERAGKVEASEQLGASAELAHFAQCDRGTRGGSSSPSRPLLHAYLLRIRHPVTGCYHEFKAPVPPDIERAANQLNTNWRRQLETILDNDVAIT